MVDQARMNVQTTRMPAIVIRGLPNSGKTTLANEVVIQLRDQGHSVFHINADAVRSSLNSDLGFDPNSRCENARRIGALTLLALDNGLIPVVDFIMPTLETLNSFRMGIQNRQFALWRINRESCFKSRFADTQAMYANTFGIDLTFPLEQVASVAHRIIVESPNSAFRNTF